MRQRYVHCRRQRRGRSLAHPSRLRRTRLSRSSARNDRTGAAPLSPHAGRCPPALRLSADAARRARSQESHRYGSDWLVSGKRQFPDIELKGHEYRKHDTLKRQSTFDSAQYQLGGELRQTRFHKGFDRRPAAEIRPFDHRLAHDEAMAERSRAHAPRRRGYLASQVWRNGKNPIANPAPGTSAVIGPHLTYRHGDPFDPWEGTVHRTFGDASGGNGEGAADVKASTMPPMRDLGAFPGQIKDLDTHVYGTAHWGARAPRRHTLVNEGLGAMTKKNCGVADAFSTYNADFNSKLVVDSVKDHVTKPM